ncbi:MAG: AfsR/SARP family transcriptional regulator [Dehalococcoidia bacterium]
MQLQRTLELPGRWDRAGRPILICLLGGFRLVKSGETVSFHSGGKGELLLSTLALRRGAGVPRETVIATLWPNTEATLANQSLSSLVHSMDRLLGGQLGVCKPVLHVGSSYQLNLKAGVSVGIECVHALVRSGDEQRRADDHAGALESYRRAVQFYRGDLCAGTDIYAVIERERLRAQHLTLLARLADDSYESGDYGSCLEHALSLLSTEPCREDAHRMVMRCYVRRGERAQALRQYRVCEQILRSEFDAVAETATTRLFDQVRLNPSSI